MELSTEFLMIACESVISKMSVFLMEKSNSQEDSIIIWNRGRENKEFVHSIDFREKKYIGGYLKKKSLQFDRIFGKNNPF